MKTLLRSNLLVKISCFGHHPSQIHSFLSMSEFQWERSWPAATYSNNLIFIKCLPSECIGCNLLILKVQNLKQGSTCQYRFLNKEDKHFERFFCIALIHTCCFKMCTQVSQHLNMTKMLRTMHQVTTIYCYRNHCFPEF